MKNARDISFIVFFLLLLAVPLCIKLFHIPVDETNSEKKAPPKAPVLTFAHTREGSNPVQIFRGFTEDLSVYKTDYDRYYTDNFKLKNNLFDLYVGVKRGLLHGNPIPNNVLEGSDGWFFLGNSYCGLMLEYVALSNFSQEDLKTAHNNMVDNAAWLKARNTTFYVVIAPDKQFIYGEHLPLIKAPYTTKLEQVKEANRNHDYPLLDLTPVLMANKQYRLFHKTDTHWNEYGAFVSFCTIMDSLRKTHPGLPSLSLTDLRIDTFMTQQRDLTEMMRIKVPEEQYRFRYKEPEYGMLQKPKLTAPANSIHPKDYEERYVNKRRPLKIVIFRDSFGDAWISFFKECFGECVFIRDEAIDKKVIEQEAPDIVLYEKVERDMDLLLLKAH